MKSQQQDEIRAALDEVDAGYAKLRAACSDSVGNAYRVDVAERLERQCRTNRGLMYRFFGELSDPPDGPDDPDLPRGTVICKLLWQRLRITVAEAKRRTKIAGRICPRRSLTGPTLPPELPQLAEAVADGDVDDDHIHAVCKGIDNLPSVVRDTKRGVCERILVRHAKEQTATFVANLANDIAAELNPDTVFDEQDRRRKAGIHMGRQQPDGMTYFRGWADPELRGYLEAAQAAVRPGRHRTDQTDEHVQAENDRDVEPVADDVEPVDDDVASHPDGVHVETPDARTPAQRLHDALKLGMRAGIASGIYGQHRGLPVTVIATATLAQLEQAIHAMNDPSIPMPPAARTGGGSRIPMRDLLRMAANAIHYLAIFDDHSERPLYLGRTKRIASADQRIICYARDRGCTRPGCTEPGYHCDVNHEPPWNPDGQTDADCLFFDCGPDHALITKGLLQTEVTDTGRLAYLDSDGKPEINLAHHPEELLKELFEDDEEERSGDP